MTQAKPLNLGGILVYKSWISPDLQIEIVDHIRKIVAAAPLFSLKTAGGRLMSVQMSAAGKFGWFSDQKGYRYEPMHPNGTPWPDIPAPVLDIWDAVSGSSRSPECCLINHYRASARMGLHQDKDEKDFAQPVVSISLGDDALFRVGGKLRTDKTQSIWLASGDVCVLGGDARLAYHGIDRVRAGTSTLLRKGGRINLTLRVVD
jgi:alkylated DNA repair protein (DNA oxidative demethylase)